MDKLLILFMLLYTCNALTRKLPQGEPTNNGGTNIELRMPGIMPQKDDDYICTSFDVKDEEKYITQFKIEGSADRAHHMLLYGCGDLPSKSKAWDCGHHGVCSGHSSIMFAWAKNAPPTSLPPSVGFRFGGPKSPIKYLVLQIHYAHPLPPGEKDYSGMDIDVTTEEQKYIAGIFLTIGGGFIPPHKPKVHADACCKVNIPATMHLFAYRTHAHSLGRVITGYRISNKTGKKEEIARGNPQWPQAFYGMPRVFDLESGDTIGARCTYDSTDKDTPTFMGGSAGDEMCNLYVMYYTDAKDGTAYQTCGDQCKIDDFFPLDSDEPLPPNPLLEEHALHGSHAQTNETITINKKMSINLEQLKYDNVFGTEDDPDGSEKEIARKLPPGEPTEKGGTNIELRMPGIMPKKDDDYLCTAFDVKEEQKYITQYKIEGSADRAHHMILYGCGDLPSKNSTWDCGHHGVCSGHSSIMFAWAKNAPPTSLPPSVGFRFGGPESPIKYLVLQIHYAHQLPPGEMDYSGMDIDVTTEEQKYIAGIFLTIGGAVIPPHQPKVHADACCKVNIPATMHFFAYRTHAHGLGRVITGYRISSKTGKKEEIARGNPQWPQAFYGMPRVFDLENDDIIGARCTYDSTAKDTPTYMGSTAGDEMCNLYIMYYTDAKDGTAYHTCTDSCQISDFFPLDSDVPLPPNPLLEEHALHGNHAQTNETITINNKMSINLEQLQYNNVFGTEDDPSEPKPEPMKKAQIDYATNHVHRKPGSLLPPQDEIYNNHVDEMTPNHLEMKPTEIIQTKFYSDNYVADPKWLSITQSQPSAVGIDSKGNVVVFHRASRAWGSNTFGFDNRLANPEIGPIEDAVIILFDPTDSRVINKGGQNMFYLPHGLTIDQEDCLWVTDVGAHQVFKLTPLKEKTNGLQILIELGRKLNPGSGDGEFCKPTSVAVLPSGEFFVADGYCNSRIIKYTKAGVRITEWKAGVTSPMNIPHSLTLVPESDMVCVADRENGRIQCFSIFDGRLQMVLKFPEFRTSLYAVAYTAGNMYAVSGPSSSNGKAVPAQGFIIDMKGSGEIVALFGSKTSTHLGTPHALAIGRNGSSIYIADIAPYRVIKLIPEALAVTPASSISPKPLTVDRAPVSNSVPDGQPHLVDLDMSSFSTSMIILSILAVPLLIILLIVILVRLRKRVCCSDKRTAKLDLGSLLGHRDPIRGGFEKLAMEDSDGEGEMESDSDADVVEFTKAKRNGRLSQSSSF